MVRAVESVRPEGTRFCALQAQNETQKEMVLPFSSVVRFFALRAKKRTTKEDKVPLCMTTSGHCVSPVNETYCDQQTGKSLAGMRAGFAVVVAIILLLTQAPTLRRAPLCQVTIL
jgi:hypothetical protein